MTMVGVGALMILRDPSQTWLLYVYVIFFGIGFGSRAVIFSALTADIFSGKGFGSILGYSTVAVGVGGALGSWLGGAFYDWTGSYLVSFALSALVVGLSPMSASGSPRCRRWPIAISDSSRESAVIVVSLRSEASWRNVPIRSIVSSRASMLMIDVLAYATSVVITLRP